MPAGRPTVIDNDAIRKLEEAFLLGCSDLEACLFAGIGKTAFYNYKKDNEEFAERVEILKSNPVMKARKVVMDAIDAGDENTAKWVIDKRDGRARQSVDLTSSDRSMSPKNFNDFYNDPSEPEPES